MSVQLLGAQQAPFEILGRNTVDSAWNGSPLLLQVNENANMPQTPAGTMLLAWQNEATQNNLGEIAVTSGGSAPVTKRADALAYQPSIWLNNWNANNLSITNISANTATPIRIQAIGPGIPGTDPETLPIGGDGVMLKAGMTAQGNASPQYMQLVIRSSSSTLGIIGLIGGPQDSSGNNGYVITVNDAVNGNTGPDTGKAPPPGYYATTSSNTYTFTFNWGSSLVFVANLSPETADPVTVVMRKL
ncbi:MAG TPA: hypothetical protein VKP65_08895 [Rhodothermales bacterium]|nr:hypothetical protein [Rhodothermales bacterium]